MRTQRLKVLEKVGFGAGDMAVNVVISAMFLIITFFYTDIFGLKPSDIGLLLLVASLVDAVTDPLMGLITDRFTTRWGRYRPYFLFFSVPFGVSVFLRLHARRTSATPPSWLGLRHVHLRQADVHRGRRFPTSR